MAERDVRPFIDPVSRRDVLLELNEIRASAVASRIGDIIARAVDVSADDKKDGKDGGKDGKDSDGKEGSKDGKDGKDGSDDKETCDSPGDWVARFGDPANLAIDRMAAVSRLKATRLQGLLKELGPII